MVQLLGYASSPSVVRTPFWDGPLQLSKCRKKFILNNCNHVLESWYVFLKTSYFHSLTETLEWSIVLWLVNHSNCLNGQ